MRGCVDFHDIGSVADEQLKYAVIMAQEEGRWLICRHKERETWEIPGGHIEKDETPDAAAARELKEEIAIAKKEMQQHYRK